MRVLRSNDAAIAALLEAFVYDPLISWRLLQTERPDADRDAEVGENGGDRVPGVDLGIPNRRRAANENEIFDGIVITCYYFLSALITFRSTASNDDDSGAAGPAQQEVRNDRAIAVYERVQHKLTGKDFDPTVSLTVVEQVEKLIQQARSIENLCQCYRGW